jgi:hypothetical protein
MNLLWKTSIIVGALLLSGCASKNVTVNDSEFLKYQEGFEKTAELEGTKTYINQNADFTKYKNIYVSPIKVISAKNEKDLTPEQKLLVKQISKYVTIRYKELLNESSPYNVVDDANQESTLIYEASISSVSVEFDELSGMNYMPMMFVGKMIARATFEDKNIRILGEGRLKDAQSNKVLVQMMRLQKGKKVNVDEDKLVFEDVKPAIDKWLNTSKNNLKKLHAGIVSLHN